MLRSFTALNKFTGATRLFHVNDGSIGLDAVKIQNITGIDAVDAQVLTSQFADTPGMAYQGTIVPGRNIVLNFRLDVNYSASESIEALRRELTILFQQGTSIRLTFTRDDPNDPEVYIDGYVEKIPAPYFVQDPIMQVSLICVYPYFTSTAGMQQLDLTVVDPAYIATFDIRGSAQAPYELRLPITAGKTLQQVAVTFRAGYLDEATSLQYDGVQSMSIYAPALATGAYVSFYNYPGKRSFSVRDSGGYSVQNLLFKMQPGADWPDLIPKHQSVAAFTSYTDSFFNRNFSLLYIPRFSEV